MTFSEWLEVLQREYPYIGQARMESHSVHQGEFYGKHAIQIDFIVTTGLVIEYDSTRRRDGSKKEGGRKCGIAGKNKSNDQSEIQQCNKQSPNDTGQTE